MKAAMREKYGFIILEQILSLKRGSYSPNIFRATLKDFVTQNGCPLLRLNTKKSRDTTK